MKDCRGNTGRAFRPSLSGRKLEDRRLMTAIAPAINLPFRSNPAPNDKLIDFDRFEYVANRRDGFAEITLHRTNTNGDARVVFSTDAAPPGSPYQTVSTPVLFRDGEATASVAVPLVKTTAASGDVVVGLQIQPQTPGWYAVTGRSDPSLPKRLARTSLGPPAVLRVVDRTELVPPKIIDATVDRTGVTLTFDEPMNEASVEDPRAYVVQRFQRADDAWWRKTSIFIPKDKDKFVRMPVRAATYDPATNSVHLRLGGSLSAGRFVISSPNQVNARRSRPLDAAKALKDQTGNSLTSDLTAHDGVSPGTFRYIVKSQRGDD